MQCNYGRGYSDLGSQFGSETRRLHHPIRSGLGEDSHCRRRSSGVIRVGRVGVERSIPR